MNGLHTPARLRRTAAAAKRAAIALLLAGVVSPVLAEVPARIPATPLSHAITGRVVTLADHPEFQAKRTGASVAPGEMRAAELDGDGRSDLLFLDEKRRIWHALLSHELHGQEHIWAELPPHEPVVAWVLLDADGDGRNDIAANTSSGGWWVALAGESSAKPPALWASGVRASDPSSLAAGDFDGNGCDDIFLIDEHRQTALVGTSDCHGVFDFREWSHIPFEHPLAPLVFDPDADGRADVHLIAGWTTTYLLLAGRQHAFTAHEQRRFSAWGMPPHHLIFQASGDLNGDVHPDIVAFNSASNNWAAVLYPGNEMREWSSTPPMASWSFLGTGDFNGDSLTDTVARARDGRSWSISLSEADTGVELSVPTAGLSGAAIWRGFAIGDFDGDRIDDIAGWEEGSGDVWLLLSRISKGLAGVSIWPSSDLGAVRSDEQGAFQLNDVPDGTFVSAWASGLEFAPRFRQTSTLQRGRFDFSAFAARKPPYVCVGFNSDGRKRWGSVADGCPKHHAYYSLVTPGGGGSPESSYIEGTCCPLPSDDILTDDSLYVTSACPPGFVATGARGTLGCKDCTQEMRCTRINTNRYQLGPAGPGVYWGVGYSRVHEARRLSRAELPAAIRYGVGRLTRLWWDEGGCIGEPWGSLPIAKRGRRCSDLLFSELQYRGAAGDPPNGTPVTMYPDCREITGSSDPRAACAPQGRSLSSAGSP